MCSLIADKLTDLSYLLGRLAAESRNFKQRDASQLILLEFTHQTT